MVQGSDSSRDKMKARTVVVCACAIFMVFLVVETWCAPKSKAVVRNWGPQSMLYLKGRYGRRYASDNEEQYYKLNLEDFSSEFNSNRISEHQKKIYSPKHGY